MTNAATTETAFLTSDDFITVAQVTERLAKESSRLATKHGLPIEEACIIVLEAFRAEWPTVAVLCDRVAKVQAEAAA